MSTSKSVAIRGSWCYCDLVASSVENTTANTSTVTLAFSVRIISGYSATYDIPNSTKIKITVDGTTTTKSLDSYPTITTGQTALVLTTTHTVNHDADGSKSLNISFTYNPGGEYTGTGTISSWSLPTIPRESTINAPTFKMGTQGTFTVTKASSAYTHTVTYSFGSYSGTICTKSSATSVNWTPPASLANAIPSALYGTATITITTYSGSTQIGSAKTSSPVVYVPDDAKPGGTLAIEYVNSNSTIAGWNVLVKGYSKIKWTYTPVLSYGSPISSYSFVYKDSARVQVTGTTATGTSGTLAYASAEQTKPTITVTDARGRSATITAPTYCLVYDYGKPGITSVNAYRSDSSGVADESGTYCYNIITGNNLFSCGGNNAITCRRRVMEAGGSWSAYTTVTSGTAEITSGFLTTASYTVEMSVVDSLGSVMTRTFTVASAYVTLNVADGGKSIGVFGYASGTEDEFSINGSLVVDGNQITGALSGTKYDDLTSPTSVQAPTLTGGYVQEGYVVFVQLRIANTSPFASGSSRIVLEGLPRCSTMQALCCEAYSVDAYGEKAFVTTAGKIYLRNDIAIPANTYIYIHGMYLASDADY